MAFEFGEDFDFGLLIFVPFHSLLGLLEDGLGFGLFGREGTGNGLVVGMFQLRVGGLALVREGIFDGFSKSAPGCGLFWISQ